MNVDNGEEDSGVDNSNDAPKAYSLYWVEGIHPENTDKFVETVGDHRG